MTTSAHLEESRFWRYKAPPVFSEAQSQRWQALLEQRTGISYALHTSILRAGIYRRMVEIGCDNYDAYYQTVHDGIAGFREWSELLNCVTVQDTRFFRDPVSFNYIRAYLQQRIPALKQRGDVLELWSAGCATGEEAWSLAMLADDLMKSSRAPTYFGVLGSDISSAALSTAKQGLYRETQLGNVSTESRSRCLQPLGNDRYRVVDQLTDRVCFVTANLNATQESVRIEMDVILCQNVLIYFREACRNQVLDKLIKHLKPGGLIVLGAGESTGWKNSEVARVRSRQVEAYIRK